MLVGALEHGPSRPLAVKRYSNDRTPVTMQPVVFPQSPLPRAGR